MSSVGSVSSMARGSGMSLWSKRSSSTSTTTATSTSTDLAGASKKTDFPPLSKIRRLHNYV
ncbi:hypothetical protein FRC09_007823, partial [Ceratobasidium sp. 395]